MESEGAREGEKVGERERERLGAVMVSCGPFLMNSREPITVIALSMRRGSISWEVYPFRREGGIFAPTWKAGGHYSSCSSTAPQEQTKRQAGWTFGLRASCDLPHTPEQDQ